MTDFDFRQKIARCVLYATKPFSVPENALPLVGGGKNHSEVVIY
ncbi:hypothetical protein HMPREF9441_02353 [Paraprevotella clara YIT 11840]|uniref:Uncharacterized protein n=1 Tax=Paraprevotella clara YIT 11840 TaxID=762968 RepID=G5SSK3_9BACT|nr:hypothetical protein HMPREF9441_02353 [Paraprevotella clara YIT 11840]